MINIHKINYQYPCKQHKKGQLYVGESLLKKASYFNCKIKFDNIFDEENNEYKPNIDPNTAVKISKNTYKIISSRSSNTFPVKDMKDLC